MLGTPAAAWRLMSLGITNFSEVPLWEIPWDFGVGDEKVMNTCVITKSHG